MKLISKDVLLIYSSLNLGLDDSDILRGSLFTNLLLELMAEVSFGLCLTEQSVVLILLDCGHDESLLSTFFFLLLFGLLASHQVLDADLQS